MCRLQVRVCAVTISMSLTSKRRYLFLCFIGHRSGSYRLRTTCKTCPSTGWLLILLFVAAVIGAATSAMYLSKTKIHFAGLGIGLVSLGCCCATDMVTVNCVVDRQVSVTSSLSLMNFLCRFRLLHGLLQDFLQVMSMFGGFEFDWPPEVLSLFNTLTLFNFDFDLLAPECSISVGFEEKWYAVQCLPLLMIVGIVVVLGVTRALQCIQRRVFHVLPFGAMSNMSLEDICIGMGFTGLFMMYFGTRRCLAACRCCCASSSCCCCELPCHDEVSHCVTRCSQSF